MLESTEYSSTVVHTQKESLQDQDTRIKVSAHAALTRLERVTCDRGQLRRYIHITVHGGRIAEEWA